MHLVSHQAYILERAYNVPNKKNLPLTKFFHIGVLGNAFLSFTHGAALKFFVKNSMSILLFVLLFILRTLTT